MLGLILAITASPLPFTVSGEARWWIAGIPLTQPGIELAITWWCRGMAAGGLILSILAPLPLGACCKLPDGGVVRMFY